MAVYLGETIAKQLLEIIRRDLVQIVTTEASFHLEKIDEKTLAIVIAQVLASVTGGGFPITIAAVALARLIKQNPAALVSEEPAAQAPEITADGTILVTASIDGHEEQWSIGSSVRTGLLAIALGVASSAVYDGCKMFWRTDTNGPNNAMPPSQEEPLALFVVTGDDLRVRKGPSFEAEVVGKLSSGSYVSCFRQSGDWRLVVLLDPLDEKKSETGWVHKSYLQRPPSITARK